MEFDESARPHFRVLGPVRVRGTAGEEADLPPGRQTTVLAALLLDVNRAVAADHLIDLVWPRDPPATARTQIQICVSALRKELTRIGHPGVLRTQRPGYLLQLPDDEVDHRVFAALVQRAARLEAEGADPAAAAEPLRAALALWRGPALDGVGAEGLQGRVAHLEEQRLAAFETWVDLRLQMGEHDALVAELRQVTERNPLRERPAAQLMTALHRSGRRAEALDVYREVRGRLVEQLGIEPGAALRAVHEEVLAEEDPAPPAREPAVAAAAPARPFQLPADTGDFGGRDEVRDEILAELGDDDPDRLATPVVVLVGKPGVGKSALAVHVAHRLRDRFPDGQLYCELGGSGYEPVPPAEVLARFARALGAPGSAIPDDEVGRAELYRTLVAGRRMLVVLEDAAGEQQVRALLPGTGSCAVIVTSRTMLTGLPGAAVHELDVLDPQRARELLARVVGAQRVAAEPATADALVRMVGNLPLALRIVAARLAARPRWPLAVMVERLTDERRRLDELTHGELMMRASLAMSYDGLDPAAARLLRLLGLVEVDSYPVWLAAALLDATESEAAWLLELLVDVHLLEVAALDLDGTPRYRFHLIIRLFARERLHDTEPPEERTAAVLRAAGAWLALVDEAHRRLYGGDFIALRSPAPRRPPARRTVGRLLSDPLAWLEAERANLSAFVATAAAAGPAAAAACWDLAVGMVDLFESGAYHDDWATTHRTALRVAADAGDRRGEAAVLASLGTLHLTRGRTEEAERVLDRALALFTELGDTAGTALVQRDRAWVDQVRGDDAAAARGYRAALAGFESVGDPVGRAHVLGRLADTELAAGAPERARELLEQALELVRDIGNARVELQTLFRLGTVALAQGRLDEAEAVLAPLLERVRLRRDLVGEARVLQQLAAVRVRAGAPGDAVELLERAVEVRERGRDRAGAAELRDELERARAAAATAAADRA